MRSLKARIAAKSRETESEPRESPRNRAKSRETESEPRESPRNHAKSRETEIGAARNIPHIFSMNISHNFSTLRQVSLATMDYTKAPLAPRGDAQAIHGDGSLSMLSLEDFLAQGDSLAGNARAGPPSRTRGCALNIP
jgi:hypothetical protein